MMNIEKINEIIEDKINSEICGVMIGDCKYNRDANKIFKFLVNDMFKRTLNMFEYGNLPETLDGLTMEKFLQNTGTGLIVNVTEDMILDPEAKEVSKPGLYVFPCKAGGRLNAKLIPTVGVVASAYLGFSGSFDLMKDEAVYIWNDSLREGLGKLFSLYASELTDNVLTLHFQEVHNRILSIIKATSEDEKKDAEDFFESYENGEFASLMSENLLNNIKNNRVDPFKGSSNTSIKDTLEARQWLLAHWNIELGLNDNYNMKREALNENEIEANADTLTPLLDDMMKCRKRNVEEINRVYKTNITVDFSSSWKRVHKREQNAQEKEELEIDAMEKQVETMENSNDSILEENKEVEE